MGKVTWLALVVKLTACCITLANSSCPNPPSCSDSNPCINTRKACLGGLCRRCDCAEKYQCRFNSTTGLVYCDCLVGPVTGRSGTLCECPGEGCNCPDILGFAYACSEYSNEFRMFDNKKLNIRGKNVDRFKFNYMADCEEKCLELSCNAYEWKTTGGGQRCTVFRYNTLVEEEANIVGNRNFLLKMRVCYTC